jgi:hypothetical protein
MANPADTPDVEDCKKSVIQIGGENFYLMVGDAFVDCTTPRENDPTRSNIRITVESICAEITRLMLLQQATKPKELNQN